MGEIKDQILQLWQGLTPTRRYAVIGTAVIVFVLILGTSYWWGSKPNYVPLFTAMEAKDAGEVASKLAEMKIPFEITSNGTAITVPANEVYKTRLELARQGLPRGNKGFEIFDQSKFGVTEFQNKVYLLQALQGELTRTIEQMAEVDKARVHIVMPEDSLYRKNEKPATASIMLKLKPAAQLAKDQVRGIVNLTANSVRGLKPENITVVDSFAHVLNETYEASGVGGVSVTQVEITKRKQDEIQKMLESLLEQVLGPNKAAVRVSLELNFDQRTVDKQTYSPVVDDKGIVRSTQENSEAFKGTQAPTGGVAGTTSNIPGYVTGSSNGQSTFEKKDTTRNYEINETKEKVIVAPGGIKKIAVAVLVDASVANELKDKITKSVASAVGFDLTRGDLLSVESIPFNTEVADKLRREEQQFAQDQQRGYYSKIGAGAVAVLAVFYLAYRIMNRRREQELEVVTMGEGTLEEQAAAMLKEKELSPQEKMRTAQFEEIEKMAKANPEAVAALVRTWVTED